MIKAHDEGKNEVQLCDGENDAVCIPMGGTGGKTVAAALENLGLAPKVYTGSYNGTSSDFISANTELFENWTYTAKYIPAFDMVFFRGYVYSKASLEANEDHVAFMLNNLGKFPASTCAFTVHNGGNACGDARIQSSNGKITVKFPITKSAGIGIFITGFWIVK